jgi:hypothetical protein
MPMGWTSKGPGDKPLPPKPPPSSYIGKNADGKGGKGK